VTELDYLGADYPALSHAQRLEILARMHRDQARLDAARTRLLAAIETEPSRSEPDPELDKHWDREEVACILKVASSTARNRMLEAVQLVSRYPATLSLLESGQIGYWHALRLVEAGLGRGDAVMAVVEARVLPRAAHQSVSQFRAAINRALAALDPQTAEQARASGIADRRVVLTAHANGTSDLWAPNLPTEQASALINRITEQARAWDGLDDRSADQRQADALIALVLGAGDASRVGLRPTVNVVVALSTLLELDEQAADLDGHPVPAAVARALAFDPTGTWRRLLTDAAGRLVDVTAHSYQPPAAIARLVRLRQPSCVFPHCRAKAEHCELDHVVAWADGGPTTAANLQPLCARHHHLKHEAGWTVHRQRDGTTIWTSPAGRQYRRPPDDLPTDTTGTTDESGTGHPAA
jgi:hypothetical protein